MTNISMAKRFESDTGETWPWDGKIGQSGHFPEEVAERLLAGAVIKDHLSGSTFKIDDDGRLVEMQGVPLGGLKL